MATEHPKVTAYVPREVLNALDSWKAENNIESRSAAIVAILADYLGVPYPVQQEGTAPAVAPSTALSSVQAELAKLTERAVDGSINLHWATGASSKLRAQRGEEIIC